MSYSFTIRAATKTQAKTDVALKFDEMALQQACHARDRAQALGAAFDSIDLLDDDESKDIVVNMSGSLTGLWQGSDVICIQGANVSVGAGLVMKL